MYQAVGRMQELVTSLDGCQDDHRSLINELFIAPLQVSDTVAKNGAYIFYHSSLISFL